MNKALPIILAILISAAVFGGVGYWLGTQKAEKTASTASATATVNASATTSADVTANWKTYSSDELGISFKYPQEWGKVFTREWVPTENDPSKGKSFSISIGRDEYGLSNPYVRGFTSDYVPFEAIENEYYTGSQTNLDKPETSPSLPSEHGNSPVGFIVKTTVAGQKTMINNSMEYVPEGSGISVSSKVFLNGRTDYKGIVIARSLKFMSERLSKFYDATENKNLDEEAVSEFNKLKGGTSDSKTMADYLEYKAWLSTFQFTK